MGLFEYVWLGGANTHSDFRSKVRSILVTEWNFDGSSTGQATGENTEVYLRMARRYPHPFFPDASLILCECYTPEGKPHVSNTRYKALCTEVAVKEEGFLFGLEQEYFLHPSQPQAMAPGSHYCGATDPRCRTIVEEHYLLCQKIGLKIDGYNLEVAPYQYEFQIGPAPLLNVADDLIVARFILHRLAEKHGCTVDYRPKPYEHENGSGCHINISTATTRAQGGFDQHLAPLIERLEIHHGEIGEVYGEGNERRLTGKHETSSLTAFSAGIGTRHTSVRVPQHCARARCGYFEDRRPAANIDPYLVLAMIVGWLRPPM